MNDLHSDHDPSVVCKMLPAETIKLASWVFSATFLEVASTGSRFEFSSMYYVRT